MRTGHVPPDSVRLARVTVDNAIWELYEIPARSSDEWHSLKLIVRARRPKANYWLAWNGARMSHSVDWHTLQLREPSVAAWLATVLTDRRAACLIYGGEASALLDA